MQKFANLCRNVCSQAIAPDGRWDGAKCSEMCVVTVPGGDGKDVQYRMFYEACDGTAVDERGVWRIIGATATAT